MTQSAGTIRSYDVVALATPFAYIEEGVLDSATLFHAGDPADQHAAT